MKPIDSYKEALDALHAEMRGQPLSDWVRDMRDPDIDGGRVSWRSIRDALRVNTGIVLSDMALLRWYPDSDSDDKTAA